MAIVYVDSRTFSNEDILGSVPVDRCVVGGAAWNRNLTKLYYTVYDSVAAFNLKNRYIDFTNPVIPTFNDWVASDYPADSATLNGHPTSISSYNGGDNSIYTLYPTDSAADTTYRITRTLLTNDTQSTADKAFTLSPTTGKIVSVLMDGVAMYILAQQASGSTYCTLCKVDLSTTTWSVSPIAPTGNLALLAETTLYTQDLTGETASLPIGLYLDVDGEVVLVYDSDVDKLEKYDWVNLDYLGIAQYPYSGSSDKSIFFGEAGVLYRLSSDGANVTLNRYVDHATQVVEPTKSYISFDERQIKVGEDDVVTLQFHALDGFGLPATAAEGRNAKFEVITSRGAIDSNDVGLSLDPSPATFRNISGIPINRTLLVPIDASGVATCYLQSARTTTSTLIQDTIKVTFPG